MSEWGDEDNGIEAELFDADESTATREPGRLLGVDIQELARSVAGPALHQVVQKAVTAAVKHAMQGAVDEALDPTVLEELHAQAATAAARAVSDELAALNADPEPVDEPTLYYGSGMVDWHPIMAAVEGPTGVWRMVDPMGLEYGRVELRRIDVIGPKSGVPRETRLQYLLSAQQHPRDLPHSASLDRDRKDHRPAGQSTEVVNLAEASSKQRRVTSARRRRVVAICAAIGLIIWIASPIVAVALMSIRTASVTGEEPRAVYVKPEPNEGEVSRPIALGLEWGSPPSLVAPGWSGVVDFVGATPGSPLSHGAVVASVDGIDRLAAQTERPFTRVLTEQDSGDDVVQLNAFLRSLNIASPEGAKFTRGTTIAVRALAAKIGVPNANSVTSFDPAWVVYLSAPGVVQSNELTVATPAPAAGESIVTLAPALSRAVLTTASTSAAPAEVKDLDSDSPSESSAPLEPTIQAVDGEILSVADVDVALGDDGQTVAADALAGLAAAVAPGAKTVPAVLRLNAKPGQWVLPASAVIYDEAGACVLVKATGDHDRSVPVSVAATSNGTVVVSGELSLGNLVGIYPPGMSVSCR